MYINDCALFTPLGCDYPTFVCDLSCLCLSRYTTSNLHRFILEKASKSMHLALKSSWLFQSAAGEGTLETNEHSIQLNQEIEMAIVNSKPVPPGSASYSPSLEASVPDLFERRKAVNKLQTTHNLVRRSAQELAPRGSECPPSSKNRQCDVMKETSMSTIGRPLGGGASTSTNSKVVSEERQHPTDEPVPMTAASPRTADGTAETRVKEQSDLHGTGNLSKTTSYSQSVPPYSAGAQVTESSSRSQQPTTLSRPTTQKQRVARGFVQKVGQITVPSARVKLPSVYSKLGSPFQYSSFRGKPS